MKRSQLKAIKAKTKSPIEWTQLSPKDKIVNKKTHFKTSDGRLIFWSGSDALKAQRELLRRSKK